MKIFAVLAFLAVTAGSVGAVEVAARTQSSAALQAQTEQSGDNTIDFSFTFPTWNSTAGGFSLDTVNVPVDLPWGGSSGSGGSKLFLQTGQNAMSFNWQQLFNPAFWFSSSNPFFALWNSFISVINQSINALPPAYQSVARMFAMPFTTNWFGVSSGRVLAKQGGSWMNWQSWFSPNFYMQFLSPQFWGTSWNAIRGSQIYNMAFGWFAPLMQQSGWSQDEFNSALGQLAQTWGKVIQQESEVSADATGILTVGSANDTIIFLQSLSGLLRRVNLGRLSQGLAQESLQLGNQWVGPFINEAINDARQFTAAFTSIINSDIQTITNVTVRAIRTTQYLANALNRMNLYNMTADTMMITRALAPILFPQFSAYINQGSELTFDSIEAMFGATPAFEQSFAILSQFIGEFSIPSADNAAFTQYYNAIGQAFGQQAAQATRQFMGASLGMLNATKAELAFSGPLVNSLLNQVFGAVMSLVPPNFRITNAQQLEQFMNYLIQASIPILTSALNDVSQWTDTMGDQLTFMVQYSGNQALLAFNTWANSPYKMWNNQQAQGNFSQILGLVSPYMQTFSQQYVKYAGVFGSLTQEVLQMSIQMTIFELRQGNKLVAPFLSSGGADQIIGYTMQMLQPFVGPFEQFYGALTTAWNAFSAASAPRMLVEEAPVRVSKLRVKTASSSLQPL